MSAEEALIKNPVLKVYLPLYSQIIAFIFKKQIIKI